jgi:hypothetical protein
MSSAVRTSPATARGVCHRAISAAATATRPRVLSRTTHPAMPRVGRGLMTRGRCFGDTGGTGPTFPPSPSRACTTTRRPLRWCAVSSASNGGEEDTTAVTVGDNDDGIVTKKKVDQDRAAAVAPLISIPSRAVSSAGDGGGGGTSKSTMMAVCKGCGGTGATPCTSCRGTGSLPGGGFHSKNHVDVKNIVGTNWTAHRRTQVGGCTS